MEMEASDGKKKTFYVVNKGNEERSAGSAICNFLYNKETGEICGRTIASWAKITIFYIIFYICLAIFSLACFALFWKLSITTERPRWLLDESLIGTMPGVGFRPMPDQDKNAESTLIWFDVERDHHESYWANELDKFFNEKYNSSNHGKTCTYSNGEKVDQDRGCDVAVDSFAQCAQGSGYGYTNGTAAPCVLVKLNKIYNWQPVHFTGNNDLPEDMPRKLKEKIKSLAATSSSELETIWVTCQPENLVDRENAGPIEFYSPGSPNKEEFGMLPNYYFPYQMQTGYESPFVFVRFPGLMRHVLVQVECRAWAKNIGYDRQFRVGSTHFELMMD